MIKYVVIIYAIGNCRAALKKKITHIYTHISFNKKSSLIITCRAYIFLGKKLKQVSIRGGKRGREGMMPQAHLGDEILAPGRNQEGPSFCRSLSSTRPFLSIISLSAHKKPMRWDH